MLSVVSFACALATPRLRIGEVKQRLARLGISSVGIVEAEALRALLPAEAAGVGHAVGLEQVRAAEGAMGAGVTVYDKKYYGIHIIRGNQILTV